MMQDEFSRALHEFLADQSPSSEKKVIELLVGELCRAVEGKKKIHGYGKKHFRLVYEPDKNDKESHLRKLHPDYNLPRYVKFFDRKEDFAAVFADVLLDLDKKIRRVAKQFRLSRFSDPGAFLSTDPAKTAFLSKDCIKAALKTVRDLYHEKRRQTRILKAFGTVMGNRSFKPGGKIRVGDTKVRVSDESLYETKEDGGIPIESKLAAKQWEEQRYNALSPEERIDLRQKAFFWIPGIRNFWEEIPGIDTENFKTPNKPMYIAFFYRWLRENSGATRAEIAKEAEADEGSVTRWRHNEILHFPYLEKDITTSPVRFGREARNAVGMFDQTLRAYYSNRKDGYGGPEYQRVARRKTLLWQIYGLLRDGDVIGAAEMGGPAPKGWSFEFHIMTEDQTDNIESAPRGGMPRTFVYITHVKADNHDIKK